MNHCPTVLTFVSHYLPGFKAGGPVRSVANLVAQLGHEFIFRVVTRDRDLGDADTYPELRSNEWQPVGQAQVLYARSSPARVIHAVRAVRDIHPDLLYFNSYFDAAGCLSPLLLMRGRAFEHIPVVIAPRGQFAAAALQLKSRKKRLYFRAFKALGLADRVIWQATCEMERDDILRYVDRTANVMVAPNISNAQSAGVHREPKQAGRLNLVYHSRVTPKKNLSGAIELLRALPGIVALDIWGPVEDAAYEQRCRQQIATLPDNVQVRWRGPLMPELVAACLARYDALLLPTLGENFGHAIVEALAAGCPVVISDRTPWRGLETRGVGWDVSLECPHLLCQALTTLLTMDERGHAQMRARSVQYAAAGICMRDAVDAHRRLFHRALGVHNNPHQSGRQLVA